MGYLTFDGTRIGGFSWDVPDATPDGPTPEEERAMEEADECQYCDHGRVLVFYCEGVCACGHCPDVEDCPECCGHEPEHSDDRTNDSTDATSA